MKKLHKPILVTVLLFLCAFALPQPALADAACADFARFMTPQVDMVPILGDVHYDTGHTLQEITALAMSDPSKKHTLGGRSDHRVVLGLTLSKFSSSLELKLAGAHLGKTGKYCVWPKKVTLEVGYGDFTVYIARQYHQGSCNYGVILNHEMGHVELDRKALTDHLDALKHALDSSLTARFPMLVEDSEREKNPIRLVRSDLEPSLDALLKERRRNNERHDLPESIQRTKEACESW